MNTEKRQINRKNRKFLKESNELSLEFVAKNKKYPCANKIYVMGIVNVTPDSFYDGGRLNSYEKVKTYIDELIDNKVDIIDLGGESSRPGAQKITPQEELNRILPFVKYIKKNYKIPLSIDTYKSEVAQAALSEGADIINDISGLHFDKKLPKIIAQHKAGVILMHIKGTPSNMQINPSYSNLLAEIKNYLAQSIKIALQNDIHNNNIIIDPGIGFGKTIEHNYNILNNLGEFKIFKRPILIGLSMKSLIGKVLDNQPEERLTGTIALNTVSILKGANIIRVHHVKIHKEVTKLLKFLFHNK